MSSTDGIVIKEDLVIQEYNCVNVILDSECSLHHRQIADRNQGMQDHEASPLAETQVLGCLGVQELRPTCWALRCWGLECQVLPLLAWILMNRI